MKNINEINWRHSSQQVSFDPSNDVAGADRTNRQQPQVSSPSACSPSSSLASCGSRPTQNQQQANSFSPLRLFGTSKSRRPTAKMLTAESNAEKCSCSEKASEPNSCPNGQEEKEAKRASGAKFKTTKHDNQDKHPLDETHLLGRLFFSWMVPFIYIGWRFGLKWANLPRRPSSDELCEKVGKQLDANWRREIKRCNWRQQSTTGDDRQPPYECDLEHRRPSLLKAVVRTYSRWILVNSLLTLFAEVFCKSLIAFSVGQMLFYMNIRQFYNSSDGQQLDQVKGGSANQVDVLDYPANSLIFWTFTLILASFSWVLSAHFYGFQMMRVGLHLRVGCSYLIYKKSLKLSLSSQSNQTTLGKMVNLLSNDLDKFNHVAIMIPFLWIGPMQTLVSIALLWPQLGPSCLGSLLILAILTPIQFHLSKKFASFRSRIASSTDERVNSLNETINAIKTIKLYGWEMPFRRRLFELRDIETNLISRVALIKGFSAALMYVSSKMVLFVTILLHCLVFEQTLDAKTLFMSMAMLNNVQFTMTQLMPRVVSLGAEALVSLGRINEFLLHKEFSRSTRLWVVDWTTDGGHVDGSKQQPDAIRLLELAAKSKSQPAPLDKNKLMPIAVGLLTADQCAIPFIQCQSVGSCWPTAASSSKTLDRITFRCQSPELVIICGQLASGKSSLFMSLLNELPIEEGTAQISGTVSYASQVPWIFNGTLRDNILFGQQFQEQRYLQVVEICSLQSDLASLEHGDLTYIQEDSLSGGQKARVNLARCLYRQCDIYLLDDPLSALDQSVAGHIFEQAICKFLSNKLVLLATHQVKYLSRCDKILLLDQGRQLAYCNYDKLNEMFSAPVGEYLTHKQLESLAFLRNAASDQQPEEAEQHQQKSPCGGQVGISSNDDGQQRRQAANDETIDSGGGSNFSVWVKYYRENSASRLVIVLMAFLCTQALFSTVDVYLTVWSMSEQNRAQLVDIGQSNQFWLESIRNNQAFVSYQMKTQFGNVSNENSSVRIDYDANQDNTRTSTNEMQPLELLDSTLNGASELLLFPWRDGDEHHHHQTYLIYGKNLNHRQEATTNLVGLPQVGGTTRIDRDNNNNTGWTSPANNSQDADNGDDAEMVGQNLNQQLGLLNEQVFHQKIDQDEILLESQQALNVKPVYRPLYLVVNNLSSADLATIYACLLMALFLCSALTNILSLKCCNRSARMLYRKLIDSALFAQMSFYDLNPIGRFLNRATRDFGIIDEAVPYNINQAYDALLQTLATLVVVTIVDLKLAPVSMVIMFVVVLFYSIQIRPTKDIQRFEGVARSPLLNYVACTLNGLQTIRSNQSASDRLAGQFAVIQDAHSSVWQLKIGCNRTTAIYLDLFNAFFISLVALSAVLSDSSGPSAGLIITSAILLSGLTQHGVMKLTETESLLTSVERVLEYCSLPQEEPLASKGIRRPNSLLTNNLAAVWPSEGRLEFKNVDLYYPTAATPASKRHNGDQSNGQPAGRPTQKPVLKNLSFTIEANEKIGIIGRTGAGKSSLISVLFRLHQFDGQVLIDGIDSKTLNLTELRTSIGIIPQNPVLFASLSVRDNLDPLGAHDDFAIWAALSKAHLRETISRLPGKLDFVLDNREQFSAGQRQLICLARVLLRQDKLLVLDEATANVDPTTDSIIQTTIRNEFKNCTVLIIAHRLETILDCDRIMCLDSGRLIDFDTPERLANRSQSYFARMLRKGEQLLTAEGQVANERESESRTK